MSKTRLKRHKLYKNWVCPRSIAESTYPAEAALLESIREEANPVFVPFPFVYTDNDDYHYHLAFMVEAVELLPLKMDLAFDSSWRAFESYYKRCVNGGNGFKLQNIAPALGVNLDASAHISTELDRLLSSTPVQSCEYFTQRILRDWQIAGTDYQRIWNRLTIPAGKHPTFELLLPEIAAKYSAPNPTPGDMRKASTLMRLVLKGDEVNLKGKLFRVPRSERISFLLNALLYTFRNDRFHGNVQPPFKSSLGTLKTYAHAHYCLIWAHFLFLYLISSVQPAFVPLDLLASNTGDNLRAFETLYRKRLLS
jgi:hypothetical protein